MQRITIQCISLLHIPEIAILRKIARSALKKCNNQGDVTIRIVDKEEMALLNETYRHQSGPTNVLSFPLLPPLLGDMIICAPVVAEEAKVQHKTLLAHFAHMIIHGILHLQGYDHQLEVEATHMEGLEIDILKQLGFANPYL